VEKLIAMQTYKELNNSVTDLQSRSMITVYEIKETTASKVLK
jgi:hypothetical protein